MAKKPEREINCNYGTGWRPLGRARTHCPYCGSVLAMGICKIREKENDGKT